MSNAANLLAQGTRDEQLIAMLLASSEYFNKTA
jgi:hypothetical protein